MLRHLFPRLTQAPSRGSALFATLVGEARREHWFVAGEVPDTLDGRFAVLTTVVALATVRLERGGAAAHAAAVALAERFVEAMDAEHRQLGIGEPGIGKTVRRLVGALARRVEQWRGAVDGSAWEPAVVASLFTDETPSEPALKHCTAELGDLWRRLEASSDDALAQGAIT
jgi:cytochrome b pre-mRNA-processing protein 3